MKVTPCYVSGVYGLALLGSDVRFLWWFAGRRDYGSRIELCF